MSSSTHLLLVTDASKKGTQVIQPIRDVADELVMYQQIGAIANRLPDFAMASELDTGNIPVLAYIPSDQELASFDLHGRNVFYLPEEAKIVQGARDALRRIDILKG